MSPRAARGADDRSGQPGGVRARGRGRRLLAVLGIVLLVGLLIAFVVSFVTGLGGGDESGGARVTGDAERGGARLDRMDARLRVEVLNAGGVPGLARRATEYLRDRGFDVVYIGNAGTFEQASTVVVARSADVEGARRIAHALGVDSVLVEPDPQLYLDATVRLGKDWPRAAAGEDPEGGIVERVRDWFDADSAGS